MSKRGRTMARPTRNKRLCQGPQQYRAGRSFAWSVERSTMVVPSKGCVVDKIVESGPKASIFRESIFTANSRLTTTGGT
jgi:hypothetical protein